MSEIASKLISRYTTAQSYRNTYDAVYKIITDYIVPFRGTFDSIPSQGSAVNSKISSASSTSLDQSPIQYTSEAAIALNKLVAIITNRLTDPTSKWVRDNGRVNFKQVYTKLIEEYTAKNSPDPIGEAMADWVKLFPDEVPYVINESEPEFQARFKTSNAAANWVDENKDLVAKYPEGTGFLIRLLVLFPVVLLLL